jgi:hypothetical protein
MAENKGLFSKFAQKMKTNKKLEIAVYSIIVIARYNILSGQTSKTTSSDTKSGSDRFQRLRRIFGILLKRRRKLANALSQIKGAGKVSVMITYESGERNCAGNECG